MAKVFDQIGDSRTYGPVHPEVPQAQVMGWREAKERLPHVQSMVREARRFRQVANAVVAMMSIPIG